MNNKIKLYGFNNLTKTLSFNIYDVCYAESIKEQEDYLSYINEEYNSDRLTKILYDVTKIIGANVINVSKQDYEPQGASVTILISEEPLNDDVLDTTCNGGLDVLPTKQTVCGHLDKSHLTVHTYPEFHPDNSISSFRVDIDVSTCGKISPLNALNYLIGSFTSDIITIDYRVRGFTRELNGKKCFIDHDIKSIQDYIDVSTLNRYYAQDVNVYQSNIFHTKMLIKEIDLDEYIFKKDINEFSAEQIVEISKNLKKEMEEIFSGANIYNK